MSAWHTVADSDAYRWVTKRGPTRALFRCGPYRRLDTERLRQLAVRGVRAQGERFDDVHAFCLFVGHNKSGSSMLGGLLDAHADAILSDESDALRYIEAGFDRHQLWWLLDRRSRNEALSGRVTARRLEPYSYAVPGGRQGESERPLVIGDSTTGTSTRRLATTPGLLRRTADVMAPARLVFVQVVRNPFDPIAVMMVRGHRTFQDAIDRYFVACDQLLDIRARVERDSLLEVRYEDLVDDPEAGLTRVGGFLGLAAEPEHLRACTAIIRPSPDQSRAMVEWTPRWIAEVERHLTDYDFLEGYSYER